ncbi:MAG: hypothetical protein ACXWT0_00315 [Methylobacter sp.]
MSEIVTQIVLPIIGGTLTVLLGIIAFFMVRLLSQFDKLTAQVSELNTTMRKIEGDFTGELGIVKEKTNTLKKDVLDFNPLWDRVRKVENDIIEIRSGGCKQCKLQN